MSVTRNLAILLTDIKGFTDKTSHQTRAAIDALLEEHRTIVLPILEKGGGKLVKTIGDAFLMTYDSPTDAVLAGVAVQEALRKRNEGRSDDDRIDVRIAINAGEVNIVEGDIFGEPVNITARIEGVAEAGEVFFTEAVYLAMNKTEVPSSQVDKFQLKGISEKVQVYKVRRETPVGSGQMPAPKASVREPLPKAVRVGHEEAAPAPASVPAAAPAAQRAKPWRRAVATGIDLAMCGLLAGVLSGGDDESVNFKVRPKAEGKVSSAAVASGGGPSIKGGDGHDGDGHDGDGHDGDGHDGDGHDGDGHDGDGGGTVQISDKGIRVKDEDVEVNIGPSGISVREKGGEERVISDDDDLRVTHRRKKKSSKDKLFPFVWLLLNAATLAAWSQTPGKKLMHLRVVRMSDGLPVDAKTGCLRSLFTLVSGYAAGLGYLWALWEKDRRGWHDLLAGTRVVDC